ncbi:MAG: DMT family transporter [Pseudomonadota bacterium]
MPTPALYLATILIWGSTWLAIRYQLGVVPIAWSVSYRFFIAALLFGVVALILRRSLRFSAWAHGLFLGLGFFLYCANYLFTYAGSQYLVTGVVAVVFSLIPLGNALWGRAVLATRVSRQVWLGAALGLSGLSLIFWPQLAGLDLGNQRLWGLFLVLVGVTLASTGNMVAALRQRRGLPLIASNFWAMLYGAGLTALYAVISGAPPAFDFSAPYILSLLYLGVFGSALAFAAYITLIERIGLAPAGYALVITPIVALGLSTLFEGYRWSGLAALGVGLTLAGNLAMLRWKKP